MSIVRDIFGRLGDIARRISTNVSVVASDAISSVRAVIGVGADTACMAALKHFGRSISLGLDILAARRFNRKDLSGLESVTTLRFWSYTRDEDYIDWVSRRTGGAGVIYYRDGAYVERELDSFITFRRAAERLGWSPRFRDRAFEYEVSSRRRGMVREYLLHISHDSPLTPLLLRVHGTDMSNPVLGTRPHEIDSRNPVTIFWWSTPPPPLPEFGVAFLARYPIDHPGTGEPGHSRSVPFVEFMSSFFEETFRDLDRNMARRVDDLFGRSLLVITGRRGAFERPEDYLDIVMSSDAAAYERAQEFASRVLERYGR